MPKEKLCWIKPTSLVLISRPVNKHSCWVKARLQKWWKTAMPCQGARSRRVLSRPLEAQARFNRLGPCVFSVFQSKLGVSRASSVCPAEADGGVRRTSVERHGEKETQITSAFFILTPPHTHTQDCSCLSWWRWENFLSSTYSHKKKICNFE